MADWWESAPLVDEPMPSFADVQGGANAPNQDSGPGRMADWRTAAARSMRGEAPEPTASDMAGALSLHPLLLAGGIPEAMSAKLLPFLARMGARVSLAKAGAGAAGGAAVSLPGAVPQAVRGDLGGAAGTLATGAALGAGAATVPGVAPIIAKLARFGLAPKQAEQIATKIATAAPAAEEAAAAMPQTAAAVPRAASAAEAALGAKVIPGGEQAALAQRLRQIAETSEKNKQQVLELLPEMYPDNWQAFKKVIMSTHPTKTIAELFGG